MLLKALQVSLVYRFMFLEGASEFSPAIIRAVRPGVLGRTVSAMQNGLNMLLQMAEDAGLNDPEHLVTIFGAEDVDPKYQLWDKEKKGLYEAASNVLAGPSSASLKATFVAQLETFCKHTRDLNKRYASGLYSSRRIARACRERNDFVMIVALDPPDFRTISDFRKRHLKALGALFLQVLKLCETAGLVKLGHVALDGTKIKANASKHKAMSYERMKKREAELKAEVARMLAAAEAADAEEDETFGKDKRGDEMPDWVGDKQKRLAKIV